MKKLSIIVPAYNVEDCIERCISSLYLQDITEDEYEVIFVNDGSTDRTEEKIRNNWHGNMRIFSQKNSRQGAARNRGVRNANGEYVWFVDSDDKIPSNCMGKLLSLLDENKPDVFFYERAWFSETGEFLRRSSTPAIAGKQVVMSGKEFLGKRCLSLGPCYVYRREFLTTKNLFFLERQFYEDSELMPRICFCAERVLYSRDVFYLIFARSGSSTRPKDKFNLLAIDANKAAIQLLEFAFLNKKNLASSHIFYYAVMIFNTALSRFSQLSDNSKIHFLNELELGKIVFAMLHSKNLKYFAEIPYVITFTIFHRIFSPRKI